MTGEKEKPLLLFCFSKILHLNTTLQFTNFYLTTPLRGRYHPFIIEENSQSSVHPITAALPLFSAQEDEGQSECWDLRTEASVPEAVELPSMHCKSLTWPVDQFMYHEPAHKFCGMLEVF